MKPIEAWSAVKRLVDHLQIGSIGELEVTLNGVNGAHRGVCREEEFAGALGLGHKEIRVQFGRPKGRGLLGPMVLAMISVTPLPPAGSRN